MTDQEKSKGSSPFRAFLNWIGGLGKGVARIRIGKIEGGRDVTLGDIVGGDKITVSPRGNVGGNLVISVGGQPWKAIPLYVQLTAVLVALGLAFLVFMQIGDIGKDLQPKPMAGDFNIAIAKFQVAGPDEQQENALRLITGLVNELERVKADELEQALGDTIEVRPPAETGSIKGKDDEERASNAQSLAQKIGADVVIYGSIEVDDRKRAEVNPRFVINQDRQDEWFEYDEIAGAYRMGSTIPVEKLTNRRFRNDAEAKLAGRSRALLYIAAGVGDALAGEYELAEEMFGEALQEETWDTPDVIYVMLGNATLRQGKLADARGHYENALAQNARYSRAHIGLGGVLYLEALPSAYGDAGAGKGRELDQAVLAEIDREIVGRAIDAYQKALDKGSDRPPLADVTTKAHYGLGQALLARALAKEAAAPNSGHQDWLAATQAFQQVIADYGERENERVLELAAHAHGRLGRMYLYTREYELARQEYDIALDLLKDLPRTERIEGYVQQYEAALDTVTQAALVTPSTTAQPRPSSTPSETPQTPSTATPAPAAQAAPHQLDLDIDLQAVAASDTLAEIGDAPVGGTRFDCADLGAYAEPTLYLEQEYLFLEQTSLYVCACGYETNETAAVSLHDPSGNVVLRYEAQATAVRDSGEDDVWGHTGITKDYCLETTDSRISRSALLPEDPLGTYSVEISTQTSQLEFSFDLLPVTEPTVYYSSRLGAHVLVGFEPSESVQVVQYVFEEDDWRFKPLQTGTLTLDDRGVGLLTGSSSDSSYAIGVIRQDGSDVYDQLLEGPQLDFDALIAQNPTDPNLYFGRAVHDRKVYGKAAIQDLDRAIELDPEFARAYYERGKLYADMSGDWHNIEQAQSDWSQAIALAPDFAPAYAERGSLYSGDCFFCDLDLDQAIADFSKAIELNPGDLNSYRTRADLYEKRGWLDRAIADYDQLINSPQNSAYDLGADLHTRAKLHDRQGNADKYLGDVARAIALGYYGLTVDELDRIIEWNPTLAQAYYLRGTAFERETEKAIADLSRAIELDPTHSLAYERRAEFYEEQGNEAGALADLSRVVELNPDEVRPYEARARFYERQGDERSLLAAYDEMVDRFPNFLVARYRRGEVYESLGDRRAAMADYTALIDQDHEGSPLPYYARGRLHDLEGDRERARADLVVAVTLDEQSELGTLDDYTRAIELDPEFALAYYRRGYKNSFGSGEPALAVEDYTRALELDPALAPAYYRRGTIYGLQGEWTLAIEDYTRAMELDPDVNPDLKGDLAWAYLERGKVHSWNGEPDLAAADFKRVLELEPRPYLVEQAEASLSQLGQPGSSQAEGG